MKDRVMSGVVLVPFLMATAVSSARFPPTLNLAIALISVSVVNELIQALGITRQYVLVVLSLPFTVTLFFVSAGLGTRTAYYVCTVVMFTILIAFSSTVSFYYLTVLYSMTLMIPTILGTIPDLREFDSRHGMFCVIIVIFPAWISGIGVFAADSLWGQHKLYPRASPKRTIENVTGDLMLNITTMPVFGYISQMFFCAYQVNVSYLSLLLIGVGDTVMPMLGDLVFSFTKRSCHTKDPEELIPGHGEILGRFDNVIFVSPFVYLLMQVLPVVVH